MQVADIAVENWQSSDTVGRHHIKCMHVEIKRRLNR